MTVRLLALLFFVLSPLAGQAAKAAAPPIPYKIVTASERGTYIVLGRDLATNVAPDAGIELEP